MNIETAALVITLIILVSAGFLISLLIELRKTVRKHNDFISTIEKDVPPVIDELKQTLENLKNVTDDIQSVTGGIRELSGALTDTADNVRQVSRLITTIGTETNATIAGIKTGIRTAFGVFIKNFFHKGG